MVGYTSPWDSWIISKSDGPDNFQLADYIKATHVYVYTYSLKHSALHTLLDILRNNKWKSNLVEENIISEFTNAENFEQYRRRHSQTFFRLFVCGRETDLVTAQIRRARTVVAFDVWWIYLYLYELGSCFSSCSNSRNFFYTNWFHAGLMRWLSSMLTNSL